MKTSRIAILLTLSTLLLLPACMHSQYLSLEARRKIEKASSYQIVQKVVGALSDPKTYSLFAWLELQNQTPWRARVTMDCRFYKNTPNHPTANAVRTLVLQPWEVRTESFNAVSLQTEGLLAWCGMVDSDFIDIKK